MAWYDDWTEILGGGLGLLGTGFGVYDRYQGGRQADRNWRQQQNWYNDSVRAWQNQMDAWNRDQMFNRGQAELYNSAIGNFYGMYGDYMGRQAAASRDATDRVFSLMNQPLDWKSLYHPMTDAETAATRRGTTAQAALRTGGNEGAYIDNLVGAAMREGESSRIDRAIESALGFRNTQTSALPSLIQAMLGGNVAPPSPVAPMMLGGGGMPGFPSNFPNSPQMAGGGSTDAFGQWYAGYKQRQAAEAQRRENADWRETLSRIFGGGGNSPYGGVRTSSPQSVYSDDWWTDYTTENY